WRWTSADAARGVILRAMARAEPALIFTLMGERDTAKVRTDADYHEPLVMARLDSGRIRLRIGQAGDIHVLRLRDLLFGAGEDEDRFRPPETLDDLPVGDRCEIDLDRRASCDGRGVRIHLRDQRNQGCSSTHCADGGCGDIEKVAARVLRGRHVRHLFGPLRRLAFSSARGWSPD